MVGAGRVDLPAQTLKFRVDPELVASLEGQGGKDLNGLGVPVVISGPWASPSIHPDIEGILTNPVAAYEQLNRLGGGLAALPGAASDSAIGALIKDGNLAPDLLQNGAISGIGQLLGAKSQPSTDEAEALAPQPATKAKPKPKPVSDAAPSESEEKQEAASRRRTERSSPRSGKPAAAELPRQLGGH